MSPFDTHRKKATSEAKSILKSGPATVDSFASTLSSLPFDSELSKIEAAFVTAMTNDSVDKANDVVDNAYKVVRDALSKGCEHMRVLERFIGLRLPQMEDGNNFGVTVQMMVSKHIKETRESWEKIINETSRYYSGRADAIDKFTHLPKTSTTTTSSTSKSDSTGGKEGPESKTSTSNSTEEKVSKNDGGVANVHRIKALAAMDAQMYADLRAALVMLMDGYVYVLDNLEKNMDKLENPRGKGYGGYGSGGSSMVY